jgi:hypothetical protein
MKIKLGEKEFEIADDLVSKALEGKSNLSIEGDYSIRTVEEDKVFEKNKYEEGRKAGEEILIKEAREKSGLDFQGKTLDNLLKAHEIKVLSDAKVEPEEKLKKVLVDLEGIKKANENLISERDKSINDFIVYKSESKIDKTLDSLIPEKTILPKEDMKVLLRTKLNFGIDETGNVVTTDSLGNIIKNKTTASPLSVQDVISDFFKTNQNYLQGVGGGAGGKDSGSAGGEKQSVEEFISEMKEKNINPNSSEFTQIASERQKANLLSLD